MFKSHAIMAFVLVSFTGGAAFGQAVGTLPDRAEGRRTRIAAIDPATMSDASRGPAPDSADAEKPWLKGYQVETGVATSSIARGRPQYINRYDPSSQSNVSVNVDRLGPGTLNVSAWNATAITQFDQQPGTAVQVDLSATYTLRLGKATDLAFGYLVSLYPKASVGQSIDGAHEFTASIGYENEWVTPKLSMTVDPIRQQGFYSSLAGSRSFEAGPVTFSPQLSLGVAAFSGVPLQLNDTTASLSAQLAISGTGYVAVRGALSYLCGPSDAMPDDQQTPAGRTVPWAMLAVGVQK